MEWNRLLFNYANLERVVWRDGGKCVIIPNVPYNHHTSGTALSLFVVDDVLVTSFLAVPSKVFSELSMNFSAANTISPMVGCFLPESVCFLEKF